MLSNSELNEIFDSVFGTYNKGRNNIHWKTTFVKNNSEDVNEKYEVNQTEDGAYLFFEAPGFNKSNLNVEMEDGLLQINGKRTYKLNGHEKSRVISKEFKIGESYDPSSIEATIEDGLLTVFVPNYKKQEKKKISLL